MVCLAAPRQRVTRYDIRGLPVGMSACALRSTAAARSFTRKRSHLTPSGSFTMPLLIAQSVSVHWIALPAFLVFLGVQIYLFQHHQRAMSQRRSALDTAHAREDELDHCALGGEAGEGWMGWVLGRLRCGDFQQGRYDRGDVLQRLASWLESEPNYVLLQRLSIIAPVFGLLITVAGFQFLTPPATDTMDWSGIFGMFGPLLLGVGVGAALTMVNHVLLEFAGRRSDALSLACCDWFDDCIWAKIGARPQMSAFDAGDALREIATVMRGSIGQYREATQTLNQTSESLCRAGAALEETAERIRRDSAATSEEMKNLNAAAGGIVRTLADVVPNIERTTFDMAESVRAFRSVAQQQLGQAASRQLESAESLAGSVEAISRFTEELREQLGSLGQMVVAQTRIGQEWSKSLQEDLLPAHGILHEGSSRIGDAAVELASSQRAFKQVIDALQESATGLAGLVRNGIDPTTQRLAELNGLIGPMRDTANAVRQMSRLHGQVAGVSKGLANIAGAAEAIRRLPDEMRTVLQASKPGPNGSARRRRPFYVRWWRGDQGEPINHDDRH